MITDDQRKMLTEFMEECPIPCFANPCREKKHTNRTFTTGNDLIAVKDALVKEGLWDEFVWENLQDGDDFADFAARLFCPVDEKGEPHFARLAAEFLEATPSVS